jgi:hypothetical protein
MMNIIKQHSDMRNVGSSINWPRNYVQLDPTSYDVYSVYESEKHYLWCTGQSESTLEKLAVGFAFLAAILVLCFSVLVVF